MSLTWESSVRFETFIDFKSDHVHEEGQRHKNCNLQSNLEMKNKNLVDSYTLLDKVFDQIPFLQSREEN